LSNPGKNQQGCRLLSPSGGIQGIREREKQKRKKQKQQKKISRDEHR
jgi:hypothetical protein